MPSRAVHSGMISNSSNFRWQLRTSNCPTLIHRVYEISIDLWFYVLESKFHVTLHIKMFRVKPLRVIYTLFTMFQSCLFLRWCACVSSPSDSWPFSTTLIGKKSWRGLCQSVTIFKRAVSANLHFVSFALFTNFQRKL